MCLYLRLQQHKEDLHENVKSQGKLDLEKKSQYCKNKIIFSYKYDKNQEHK